MGGYEVLPPVPSINLLLDRMKPDISSHLWIPIQNTARPVRPAAMSAIERGIPSLFDQLELRSDHKFAPLYFLNPSLSQWPKRP